MRLAFAFTLVVTLTASAPTFAAEARGDANADNFVTVADALYLISFLFGTGQPPVRSCLADVDANQAITVADVFYLVNYLFSGGAAPPPQLLETCNSADDDCDGQIDDGVGSSFYRDADSDGYGTSSDIVQACTMPAGYVSQGGDCNDDNLAIHPGAIEACNSTDDNCNGQTDEGVATTFYRDADGDTYGSSSDTVQACTTPVGYVAQAGDCVDGDPAINPDAFEVPGNLADDNCDGAADMAQPACDGGLPSNASDAFMYAQAMDLCQTTTESPPTTGRRWGVISAQLRLADGTGSPVAASRSIRTIFGSANFPQFGTSLSVLSTGHAASQGQTSPNYVAFQGGQVMGTQSSFPSDWLLANGNNLPTAPGCPEPLGSMANDPVMLKLRIRVPSNARSLSFSTRFFSAEYPEWVCSAYNDFYVVLLDSSFAGQPANPADKNIARYTTGSGVYPIGVNLAYGNTGLFQACKNGNTGCASSAIAGTISSCTGTGDLMGTGFDVLNPPSQFVGEPGYCGTNNLAGGGTAWLTIRGNVVPGETIELRFALWDTSDGYYDCVVLLDNFQWSVEPATPGAFIGN